MRNYCFLFAISNFQSKRNGTRTLTAKSQPQCWKCLWCARWAKWEWLLRAGKHRWTKTRKRAKMNLFRVPKQSVHLFSFAMFRRLALSTNERAQANMELSGLRSARSIRNLSYWWVSNASISHRAKRENKNSLGLVAQIFPGRSIIDELTVRHQWNSVTERWFVDRTCQSGGTSDTRHTKESHTKSRSHKRWYWWVQCTWSPLGELTRNVAIEFPEVIITDDSPKSNNKKQTENGENGQIGAETKQADKPAQLLTGDSVHVNFTLDGIRSTHLHTF